MRHHPSSVNLSDRTLAMVVLCATAILLSGCGPEVWKWQEEAKLDDGKTIMVDREVTFGGARLPWERERLQSEYILRFASPTDAKTKYEYRSIGGLAPAAIAFVGGVPFVVGEVSQSDAKYFYDCPEPPMIIHRYDNGKWKRAELKALPATLTEMNLALFSNPAMDNAKAGKTATALQVNEWNKTIGKRVVGKYAETSADSIPRPSGGKIDYLCNIPGMPGGMMNLEDFKRQMRERLPKNTE